MSTLQHTHESIAERARRSDYEQGFTRINVGPSERLLSGVAGAALAAYGLKHGTPGGLALAVLGGALALRGATGYCPVYSALDLDSAHDAHAITDMYKGIVVRKTVTVNRTPAECYAFWRKLENLPRFMKHLVSVRQTDVRHSHWEAVSPAGGSVGWDAEIIADRPNELISWKSVGEADVENAGSVSFRPAAGGHGTEVSVELSYAPPAGRLGSWVARALGEEPEIQVSEDLLRFKQVMEAGEGPAVPRQPSVRN